MKEPGSTAVVEDAINQHRPRLLDFIRQRVKTKEDAEDILQDVFYQLLTSYRITEPIEQLTAWLFTVTRNKIIDWYRKKKPQAMPVIFEEDGPLLLEDILYDSSMDPDRLYERSLIWTELAAALEELPEEQRWVFSMHELEGKSFKEMSEMTGESINTLLSRKRYAVLQLRQRLQQLYDDINV